VVGLAGFDLRAAREGREVTAFTLSWIAPKKMAAIQAPAFASHSSLLKIKLEYAAAGRLWASPLEPRADAGAPPKINHRMRNEAGRQEVLCRSAPMHLVSAWKSLGGAALCLQAMMMRWSRMDSACAGLCG